MVNGTCTDMFKQNLACAGNNAAVNRSFKVVGNTGAIAGHSIPFSNDLVLFLIRPNPRLDFGGPTTDIPTENYLLVRRSGQSSPLVV